MTLELRNADCIAEMKTLPAKSIDLFLCDLPYGCLAVNGKTSKHQGQLSGCSWDIKIDLKEFWEQVERLAKHDNTPVIHFCTTRFGNELINSKPKWFRYDLVWNKKQGVSFLDANRRPMRSHEMIYVFSKTGAYYNRVDMKGQFKGWVAKSEPSQITSVYSDMTKGWKTNGNDGTTRCPLSVIDITNTKKKGQHPTQKPLELYKWLIERYCPQNGTVLDPTFGSANSGQAAYELKRNYIGFEKDTEFFNKAANRLGCT